MRAEGSGGLRRVALKLAISLVATFAVLEVGLRVWDATHATSPGRTELRKLRSVPRYAQHPFLGYVLNPGQGTDEVNALGLRGAPVEARKPDGVVRILCLGGSTTFGAGVEADEAYPARLQARLDARAPAGVRYEVLNCGVPGYTSIDSLINLELRLLALQPDAVIVYHGVNDARLIQGREYRGDYSHVRHGWRDPRAQLGGLERWLIANVRCWAWARGISGQGLAAMSLPSLVFVDDSDRLLVPPEPEVNQAGVQDFLRNLRHIVAIARANGVEACLTTFATREPEDERMATLRRCIDAMNDGIVALAAEVDAPLLDLRSAIGDQPDLFWDFVHCNAAGCDRQAQAIVDQAPALGLWGLGG
jgi:lysophospholipase L1-like esterase